MTQHIPCRSRRPRWQHLIARLQRLLLAAALLAAGAALLWRLLPGGQAPEAAAGPDFAVQDILPKNEWSRPGTALEAVNGVVIHYVGNPGTTAQQNRSYYGNLASTHETYASSHFLIGMDGTVLQCVPLDEVAYCSNRRNSDTISIECCHPDDTGRFTDETYAALLRLTRWLMDTYGLGREDLLRHYDVTGKECPRWFVQDEGAWLAFLDAVSAEAS